MKTSRTEPRILLSLAARNNYVGVSIQKSLVEGLASIAASSMADSVWLIAL